MSALVDVLSNIIILFILNAHLGIYWNEMQGSLTLLSRSLSLSHPPVSFSLSHILTLLSYSLSL